MKTLNFKACVVKAQEIIKKASMDYTWAHTAQMITQEIAQINAGWLISPSDDGYNDSLSSMNAWSTKQKDQLVDFFIRWELI